MLSQSFKQIQSFMVKMQSEWESQQGVQEEEAEGPNLEF